MKFVYTVIAVTAIGCTVASSDAAPRKVIAENFTATWCTYCPDVANGLIMLQDEFPDTFFPVQVHGGDAYSTTWGDIRNNFYNVPGYPTVWMDGVSSQVGSYGSPTGNYNALRTMYMARQNASTDVTIDMCGTVVDSDTYSVGIEVRIEGGGTGKTMYVHCAQVLHDYPANPSYNYGCFMQADMQQITLAAGGSQTISFTMNLNSASVANIEDVSFIAWAQTPNNSGPAEVHQAAKHVYNGGDCTIDTFIVGPGGDFVTISDAIAACGSGDTVQVMPGTYYESIDFGGLRITVESIDGPESTIIDGSGLNEAVVRLWSEESSDAVLRGFTIQNGNYVLGSGIVSNSTATIENCIIRDNQATYGGGIYQSGSGVAGLNISGTHFCGNTPSDIEGLWNDEGGNTFDVSCEGNPCPADIDGNGSVSVVDLLAIIDSWGACSGCVEDIDGNGIVDVTDLLTVVGAWGPC
jgi:hypothetical protein